MDETKDMRRMPVLTCLPKTLLMRVDGVMVIRQMEKLRRRLVAEYGGPPPPGNIYTEDHSQNGERYWVYTMHWGPGKSFSGALALVPDEGRPRDEIVSAILAQFLAEEHPNALHFTAEDSDRLTDAELTRIVREAGFGKDRP